MARNGIFSVLPTEICYSITSYLDPEDAAAFARCSRYCYSVAFQSRFRGIKLHDDNYKRFLKTFTGTGWLAPLKCHIRSMSLTMFTLDTLRDLHSAASVFPNLQSFKFTIFSYSIFSRNVYSAIFQILSTLPFYDNINNIAVIWTGIEEEWYSDIDIYRLLPDPEKPAGGLYEWMMRQLPRAQELLGPCLTRDEFSENMRRLQLPKSLQSFRMAMEPDDYMHLLPILSSTSIQTLYIQRAPFPFITGFSFPTIRHLTLSMNSTLICYQQGFQILKYQFPNLDSLTVTKARWEQSVSYMFWFPEFPEITHLDIPWPGSQPHKCRINALEHFISPMLHEENRRDLEKCTFRGRTCSITGPRDVVATCTISKKEIVEQEFTQQIWEFYWEGDIDFDQMENDWLAWEDLEPQEDFDSDYVASEDEGPRPGASSGLFPGNDDGESSEDAESDFSGDSEYPDTGDELYPIDTEDEMSGVEDFDGM
ncbi:hypothetical protein TWF718_008439 [Orbilia javanica]|uniref:F-box domain-containing protein n=1 Tax=Orbilia javanica TaxID=47235 RepID=A0AAN8RD45_9PEZI